MAHSQLVGQIYPLPCVAPQRVGVGTHLGHFEGLDLRSIKTMCPKHDSKKLSIIGRWPIPTWWANPTPCTVQASALGGWPNGGACPGQGVGLVHQLGIGHPPIIESFLESCLGHIALIDRGSNPSNWAKRVCMV